MFTQFFKKNLFLRVMVFTVIVNFLLTCGPVGSYCSDVLASDSLKTPATVEKNLATKDIGEDLRASRDGGTVAKDDPKERIEQIETLLAKISKEYTEPRTGNLPRIAIISDYHGGVGRFAQLLSDILREFSGFKGQIDPTISIETQLNAQGLSLKAINGAIYFNGDLLDRGKDGIKCFNLVKEMRETAPEKVFYDSGNHDLWAFLNLMGFHLPWYKGFNFYDDSEAAALVEKYRKTNPELFDTPDAFLWWTERLAEFNELQSKFQKEFLGGKAEEIREKFVGYYGKYSKNWNQEQVMAWEFFAGHFASLDVPDPEVGLNGMGKTSAMWWQDIHQQLIKGREARRNTGADGDEIAAWDEAIVLAGQVAQEVNSRLNAALSDGKWWYRILESINNKAYESVEWWGKDWSSHKGWGEEVINEINKMIDKEVIKEEKLTQANYPKSPTLQSLAKFYKENFNLYLKDPYGNLLSHSWFPVEKDGQIVIKYKGKTYTGKDIFEALKVISNDIMDPSKKLSEVWEALNLVNTWYADKTTRIKPNNIKQYREKIGIAKIQSNLGVRNWFTGHNPLNKLKTSFMNVQEGYAHFEVDKGMAEKFGGEGAYVLIGPKGIKERGFESKESEYIIDSPRTIIASKEEGAKPTVIQNPGIPAKEYLERTFSELLSQLGQLRLSFADTQAVNKALEGIVEVTPTGVRVINEKLLRDYLIENLVYDATFNPNPEVVALTRKLIKDIAAAQGAVLKSVYDLYLEKAKDPTRYTVPAINIRGMAYNSWCAAFESAIANNVGVVISEIAGSEIKYTAQRPAEYATSVLAAAIKEGYKQPIFLQGDHFQISLDNYSKDSNKAREDIKKLIREAIEAGFYQIDLDMSPLVDWSKSTPDEQQKDNYTETAILTAYVRALERELGLDKLGIVVNLGGEIGEIGKGLEKGKERNSNVEDFIAFDNGYKRVLKELSEKAGYEIKPITKIAVQTGTKHGGIRDDKGEVVKAKVSFNTLAELGKATRERDYAGPVQHGASTLDPRCFVVFAGNPVPRGFEIPPELLNEANKQTLSTNPVSEVHLATAYQDTKLDHLAFPAGLLAEIEKYIKEKFPAKAGEDVQKVYIDNRKNAWGPFKLQVWNLPAEIQAEFRKSLKTQFDTVFTNLGVKDTKDSPVTAVAIWGKKLAPFAKEFPSDIRHEVPTKTMQLHKLEKGKVYPFLISRTLLLSPDGPMALQNLFAQLGKGNIQPVYHIDKDEIDGKDIKDIKPEELNKIVDEDLAKINELNGGYTEISLDMFAAVVVGTNPTEVANQVKEKVGAPVFQVIGPDEYMNKFKDLIEVRIVLDRAMQGQFTSVAKALKLAVELVPRDGKISNEELKKLDALFSVDEGGNFHVASSDVTPTVTNEAEKYRAAVEAELRV